uniref:uncharacterized protein LOC120331919 n=1 Tax=Styela clava TaxID=7725 RepID=UPI00193A877A|nr:uncharacterized protein LOC120331919 [Styela clava]
MKIICAGLQKTGTKSLAEALRILGYNVHDVFEQFYYEKELWNKILRNTAVIADYQRILEDVDAVMDFPAVAVWEKIMEAFPEAKIILTIRSNEDDWYTSIKNHIEVINQYIPQSELLQQLLHVILGPTRQEFIRYESGFIPACIGMARMCGTPKEPILRSRYRQHNCYVKSACEKTKLLIYNVKDGWEPLCHFLNKKIPDRPFPKRNIKGGMVHEVAQQKWEHDCGYAKAVNREALIRIGFLISVLVSILSVILYFFTI